MRVSRGFIVWGVGIGAVMPPFLGSVALGRPRGLLWPPWAGGMMVLLCSLARGESLARERR